MPKVQKRARRDINQATPIINRDDLIDMLTDTLSMCATVIEHSQTQGFVAEVGQHAKFMAILAKSVRRRD